MAITQVPHITPEIQYADRFRVVTVLEPYDAKCDGCGKVIRQTRREDCPNCRENLIDIRLIGADA